MKHSRLIVRTITAAGLVLLTATVSIEAAAIIADHNVVPLLEQIPPSVITDIENNYNIYYVHTSHGSQIVTGLSMVQAEYGMYNPPPFYEPGDDLGANGDTTWAPATRVYLDGHPECNMAMFSWCGGVSDNTEEGIDIYLAKMEELEAAYPGVVFIYMTGHLDGTGPTGNLYVRNNQIRDYCLAHGKILFDFADIESYSPDGTYYPDETDYCYWCYDWCASVSCPTCGSCAHSHCFNCFLKGKAWWWMMAKITGWEQEDCCGQFTAGITGNANCSSDGKMTLSDISRLIDYLYISKASLCCYAGGNTNGSWDDGECKITLSDISRLIDAIYISKTPPEACMPGCGR